VSVNKECLTLEYLKGPLEHVTESVSISLRAWSVPLGLLRRACWGVE
jgi:hypothetical protein